MKQNIIPIASMLLAIVLGGIVINRQCSEVKYVDLPCPSCGSYEVLDFGINNDGDQQAHCFDCKADFTILN